MFCMNCGTKLGENARFCFNCGTPTAAMTETPAEPVVEETPVEAVVEETPVEAVAEEVPVEPVAEEVPAEPVAEETPVEPIVEETPAEPVAEETPVEPVVEETPAEPVVEETPAEPVAEEVPAEPVVEETPAAPVVEETPAEPPVENKKKAKKEKKEKKAKKEKKSAPKDGRKKPHVVLRFLLQLMSLILCLVLTVSLVATVVLADLNRIMSKNGIQQLVNAVIGTTSEPQSAAPVAGGVVLLSEGSLTVPDDLEISDVPEDILIGGSSEENVNNLVSWLYQQIAASSEKPLTITEEQVLAFVQESNIADFVAEKLAGYADDFINNTENTTITTEEIMGVLEENEVLIEEKFEIDITAETKENMEKSVEKLVVEQDLNNVIRQEVFGAVEDAINESVASTGMTWEQIRPVVQVICSDLTLYIAIGICLVLMLLMLLLNSYNVPGGLTWIAVPCILVGGIFTGALALAPMLPKMVEAIPVAVVNVVNSFSAVLMPVHAAVLIFGAALLLIAIVWRIIRSAVARKREKAEV